MGLIEDGAVVGSIEQSRSFGKALSCHKALHLDASTRWGSQADSCARPFARRRLSTSRPPLVDIRARNPCARARLRTLG